MTTGAAPLTVNFIANATDPDGDVLTVSWDFGDGKTASGANVSHVYTSAGHFSAVVKATDKAGASVSATVNITANSAASPTLQVTSPNTGQSVTVGSSISINWTASGASITSQTIQLSFDGKTWVNVMTGLSGAARSYMWSVPNSPTQTARIRVTAYTASGQSGAAMNPGNFSIVIKPPKSK